MIIRIILPVFTFLAVIQFSVCLTWTKYPASITRVWNGSTVALQWDYNLTDSEKTAAQTAINLIWKRGNESHLVDVGKKTFLTLNNPPDSLEENLKPHITISRSEKATLIINDVTREDEGVYQFLLALLTLSSFQTSRNTTLEVRVQPIIQCPKTVQVKQGEMGIISCKVTGKPDPNRIWTKETQPGKVLSHNSTLVVNNVSIFDEGMYNITANNGRTASLLVKLEVLFAPKMTNLTSNPLNTTVQQNNNLTLLCITNAKPPAMYHFYFNESFIGNSSSGEFNVTVEGDGIYTCVPINNVGTGSNATLNVIAVVASSIGYVSNKTANAVEGDRLNFSCTASGKPEPKITWTKVGSARVITYTPSVSVIVDRPVTPDNINQYQCTARNGVGLPATATVNVTVYFTPDNVTLERNTTENNGCTDIWVNFTCNSSEANPPVYNYVLFRNEKNVGVSEKGTWIQKISQGETFVYKCQAYQQVDNVTSTNNISLSVKDPVAVKQIQNVTVEEGRNVTKECSETAGTPPLNYFWKNVKTGQVSTGKLLTIINIRRNQSGEYRYTANNTCGNESTGMFIDVHYDPDQVNLDIAPSGTVCRGSTFQFTCTADANPPVHTYVLFQNGKRVSTNESGTWTKIMNSVGKFVFKCEAQSLKGNGTSKDTLLNVDDPPAVKLTSKVTVKEGENVTGECNLTAGTPPPYQFWQNMKTGQFVKTGKLLTITNITRHQTEYKCVANNTCGRASATMFIDVKYGPLANPLKIKTVTEGEHVAIPCLKDNGNPPAVVTWYKGNDTSGNETTNSSVLEFQNVAPSNEGWYTCFAKSDVRNASATFFLNVVQKTSSAPSTEPSTASILCSKVPSENELRVSVTVEADCENRTQVAEKLVNKIVELLKNESCELGVSCVIKCGSVVVDSVLKFSKAIDGARVVSLLKEAADQGRFNGLKVVSNSIIQISYTTTSSASTESPSPTEPVCQKSFSEKENCKKNWLNIGIVVCIGVFLFVIICCLITRWVLKQRKCKKDTRVANSPVDVQPLSSNHSTLSGDKPCDYAMSGPQPPIDVKVAVCEEIPTYAVVDKAKKKDKKKNKKAAEQKAIDDQYAVVDKSKKNKKNEPDNTYAEVDMSNKSKKKPKPGEVLYADLGEFHQMQKLPEVSTSPKTLPPIKRPEAYTETQYADITQFFKGNPEATGADHPKDGAASSASSNGQGPATGSKEESSAGNTGDSAGATNETGF